MKRNSSSTACLHVNVVVACVTVLVNSNFRVCCIRASVCFACSHRVCVFLLVCSSCSSYCLVCNLWNNGSHTHTHRHTLRYLSEMPSGGHLCFPDTLHQTSCSTVYKACLLESISQTGVKTCSVSRLCFRTESERALMVFSPCDVCFFTERGEVTVGGKPQPAHPSSILCFLCSLIFFVPWQDLLEHGGVFKVVSGYTCNCIVCVTL